MKFKVHMLAFEEAGKVREVEVPSREVWDALGKETGPEDQGKDRLLDLVFRYGQNDFQPQQCCSVSVGDVVELKGQFYLILPAGFRLVSGEWLEAYRKTDRHDRILLAYEVVQCSS